MLIKTLFQVCLTLTKPQTIKCGDVMLVAVYVIINVSVLFCYIKIKITLC